MNLFSHKVSNKAFLVVVTVALLSSFLSIGLFIAVVGLPNGGFTRDIWLDDLPFSASYVVKTDGSTFWSVKDTGQILANGTNDDSIIQGALNNASADGGGIVVVRSGSYSASVTVKNSTLLMLEYGVSGVSYSTEATGVVLRFGVTNNQAYAFLDANLNLTGHMIVDGVFHSGATLPSNPTQGQPFFRTSDKVFYIWNSTAWMTWNATGATAHDTHQDYSYLIFKSGGTYYAKNGTTEQNQWSSTNVNTVLQNAINNCPNGATIKFGVGEFGDATGGYIDVDVNKQGLRLIGSGRGNDNAPYGGTVLNIASSGGLDFSNTGDERWFPYISDMTLSGGNRAGAKGIHSDNQAEDEKFSGMTIQRMYFTGFKGSGAIAIDITNHERCIIQNNAFGSPGSNGIVIRFTSYKYYAGNCWVLNNYFGIDSGVTNADLIYIIMPYNNQTIGYHIADNGVYCRDYPNYLLHLNAQSGSIHEVQLGPNNRMEYMNLLRCSGSGYIRYVHIFGNQIDSGTNLAPSIEMTTQVRSWDIHDNYLKGDTGRTAIADASNQASYPSTIHDNIFYGGGTYYSPSGNPPTEVYNNIGFVTENWGSDTLSSGQTTDTFNHGLSGTPTDVTINWKETINDDGPDWWTATSTQITVHITGSANEDYSYSWNAKYEP